MSVTTYQSGFPDSTNTKLVGMNKDGGSQTNELSIEHPRGSGNTAVVKCGPGGRVAVPEALANRLKAEFGFVDITNPLQTLLVTGFTLDTDGASINANETLLTLVCGAYTILVVMDTTKATALRDAITASLA